MKFLIWLLLGMSSVLLVYSSNKGFDFTDEAYYLLKIQSPESDISNITFFADVLHPLYVLSGDLQTFRLSGILLLFLLVAWFWKVLRKNILGFGEIFKVPNGAAFILICLHSYYAQYYILTPSYNWLALCGGIVVCIGILKLMQLKNDRITSSEILNILIINFGSLLMFASRAPGAVAVSFLIVISFFYETAWKRATIRSLIYVLVGGTSVLCLVSALSGGLNEYLSKLKFSLELYSHLKSGHSVSSLAYDLLMAISRIFNPVNLITRNIPLSLYLLFMVVKNKHQISKWLELAILLNLFFVFLFKLLNSNHFSISELALQQLLILVGFCFFYHKRSYKVIKQFSVVSLILIGIAFSTKFGSNSSILASIDGSFVFIGASLLLAGELFFDVIKYRKLYFLIWSIYLSVFLFHGAFHPYRQQDSIFRMNKNIILPKAGAILVGDASANWVEGLRDLALKTGEGHIDHLIDLTGGTPGVSVVLNSAVVGTPWLFGGYIGSESFAQLALMNADPTKLKSAWLLTSDNNELKLNEVQVLESLGLRFPENYIQVGHVKYDVFRSEMQTLWKPIQSITVTEP